MGLATGALDFSPNTIVLGLYFGNDLWDAYRIVYTTESYPDLRRKPTPRHLLEDTIGPRAQSLWDTEKKFLKEYGLRDPVRWDLWLRGHSALGRRFDRTAFLRFTTDAWFEVARAWALAHPHEGAVSEDPEVGTVFTTAYRLAALDLDDPRMVAGLEITVELLSRMQEIATRADVRLLVLLIPTKEAVYAEAALMGTAGENPAYRRLVDMERRVRSEVKASCDSQRIAHVDALPYLADALRSRLRVYPSDTEGHPLAAGYAALASACHEALMSLGRAEPSNQSR